MTTEELAIKLIKELGLPTGLGVTVAFGGLKLLKEFLDNKIKLEEEKRKKRDAFYDKLSATLDNTNNLVTNHAKQDEHDHATLKDMQKANHEATHELIKVMSQFVKQNNAEEWLGRAEMKLKNDKTNI